MSAAIQALTARERDVAAELVTGAGNQEIARRLFIAEDTVKSHVKRILRKTGTTNRAAAAAALRGQPEALVSREEILAPIRALLEAAPHRPDCVYSIAGVGHRVLIDLEELKRAVAEAAA